MYHVRSVLERSILTSIIPTEEESRRKELLDIHNPLKRMTALALHEIAIHYPDQISPLIGLGKRSSDAQPISAGFDAQVYRIGSMVRKVHKESLSVPMSQQQNVAIQRREQYSVLRSAMPGFTLPQDTEVASHPVYRKLTAAVTTQPYLDNIVDTNLFIPDTNIVNPEKLAAFLEYDKAADMLSEFIVASQDLSRAEGFIPDICGPSNLILTESDDLIMIDGQPIVAHEVTGLDCYERFENLRVALDLAA